MTMCFCGVKERYANMSQGDIEKRTGPLHVYVSPVENGHTVPALEAFEKFARALYILPYQLFYDGESRPRHISLPYRWTRTGAVLAEILRHSSDFVG